MKKERPIDRYINGTYTQRDKQSLKKSGILIMKKYSQKEVLRMIKERDFKRCIPKNASGAEKKHSLFMSITFLWKNLSEERKRLKFVQLAIMSIIFLSTETTN